MMHDACGPLNPSAKCMDNEKNCCSKRYPKDFNEETRIYENKYPLFRRRDDGKKIFKKRHCLDNRYVVPYNTFLATKYNCQINVEICSSVTAAKYLYKYVYKGHDKVLVEEAKVTEFEEDGHLKEKIDYDEISNFVSRRYVSVIEACWRIFGFPIQSLPIEDSDLPEILDKNSKTTFTFHFQLFELNKHNTQAQNLKNYEIPEFFVWNKASKKWTVRVKDINVTTCRMYTVSPADTERFYLR